jgi:hypothetical protein
MSPTDERIGRLRRALRLETPIVAVYDGASKEALAPIVRATGRECCFASYRSWLDGKTLLIERGDGDFGDPQHGCPGAQASFGFAAEYPPYMAHFLTDGAGAPMGEGLKATPEIAQEYLDRSKPPVVEGDAIFIGPLRVDQWEHVRSVIFFADPDRLSALMTLAAYWSSDPDFISAPFSSGCGLLLRELESQRRERAVLGCTDIAMRKHLPPNILCLTVSPAHFGRMVDFPDDAFLNRDWWKELMEKRAARKRP